MFLEEHITTGLACLARVFDAVSLSRSLLSPSAPPSNDLRSDFSLYMFIAASSCLFASLLTRFKLLFKL